MTIHHSARSDSDTVANRLAEVTAYESGCLVDVARASLTNARPEVADELLLIARMGCKVRVVYGDMGTETYARLRGSANLLILSTPGEVLLDAGESASGSRNPAKGAARLAGTDVRRLAAHTC
ncbi:hypothetical protein AB0283_17120 [Micromonospora vinacea]|uniref:hypothetical protein n=1 Tax=Micromonospora vinacea TaxID=709878 RepID=UPI0034510CCE